MKKALKAIAMMVVNSLRFVAASLLVFLGFVVSSVAFIIGLVGGAIFGLTSVIVGHDIMHEFVTGYLHEILKCVGIEKACYTNKDGSDFTI